MKGCRQQAVKDSPRRDIDMALGMITVCADARNMRHHRVAVSFKSRMPLRCKAFESTKSRATLWGGFHAALRMTGRCFMCEGA